MPRAKKKIVKNETPIVEDERAEAIEIIARTEEQIATANAAVKEEAIALVSEFQGLVDTMNKYGLAIEPKIYMMLEEAKKRLI